MGLFSAQISLWCVSGRNWECKISFLSWHGWKIINRDGGPPAVSGGGFLTEMLLLSSGVAVISETSSKYFLKSSSALRYRGKSCVTP